MPVTIDSLKWKTNRGRGIQCNYVVYRQAPGYTCVITTGAGRNLREYTFHVPDNELDGLCEIFDNCRLARWNGFSRYDRAIKDGASWSIEAYYDDGLRCDRELRAEGYEQYPEKFAEVKRQLTMFFGELASRYVSE